MFAFQEDRCLTAHELFPILGFPALKKQDVVTASMARDLCGEAMAVPAIAFASVLAVMALPGVWENGPASEHDVE